MKNGENEMTNIKSSPSGKSIIAGFDNTNVSRYVILTVRDPLANRDIDLAEDFAKQFLQDPILVADTKMYLTYSGNYKGVPVTICSQGCGGPETETIIGELLNYTKADTFIRLGCSGAINKDVHPGDLVIADAAVRGESTSLAYIKSGYPAVANHDVNAALIQSVKSLGYKYHVGITLTTDSFYAGQGRPLLDYFTEESKGLVQYYSNANVLNLERETSVILTLSNLFKKRGGAVNAVVNNLITGEMKRGSGYFEAATTILEGIVNLAAYDSSKEK